MPARKNILALASLLLIASFTSGCAHYPMNQPLDRVNEPNGYYSRSMASPDNSEEMYVFLTFSGGGTRAAALSYGVLEVFAETEVLINGESRRLLDEVDAISAVSGGSFTAGYYGLFGDRIFHDFEDKFLKKDIQGALKERILLNPVNWVRLFSPWFDRSDLASEYYDKHVFERGTFGDMVKRKGPLVLINATDMVSGVRVGFFQDDFDMICSDLSDFPVARAVAASSAVPALLSPVTLRNYSGRCGYTVPVGLQKAIAERDIESRQFQQAKKVLRYMDSQSKQYIHLVDGGVSDNLGLRAALESVLNLGGFWETMKQSGRQNIRKVAIVVVNAETEVSEKFYLFNKPPATRAMISSYASVVVTRYNYETIMLLRESFDRWTSDVQMNRCAGKEVSTEPGGCGDMTFYLIEVKFDALEDAKERSYFKQLPTSLKLLPDQVDRLRDAARRILVQSPEFNRFITDLKNEFQ